MATSQVQVDLEVFSSGRIRLEMWDPANGQRVELSAHPSEMRKLRDTLTEAIASSEAALSGAEGSADG